MTNKYIEVVKRWQAGEVFSDEELRANAEAAGVESAAACDAAESASEAAEAARAVFDAAWFAARAAEAAVAEEAAAVKHWVNEYEELTDVK